MGEESDEEAEGEAEEWTEVEGDRRSRVLMSGRDSSSEDESRTVSADLKPLALVVMLSRVMGHKSKISIHFE